jgi:hypothetical protein
MLAGSFSPLAAAEPPGSPGTDDTATATSPSPSATDTSEQPASDTPTQSPSAPADGPSPTATPGETPSTSPTTRPGSPTPADGSTGPSTTRRAPSSTAGAEEPADHYRYTINWTPIRSGHATDPNDPVLITAPAGVKLHVTAVVDGWSKVTYRNKTGYAYTSTHLVAKQPWDKANHYRYAKDTSPLRAGTNRYPNDKTISKVPAGVKLKISGTIGDWSRATYHGKTGFVFKTHLVINQP